MSTEERLNEKADHEVAVTYDLGGGCTRRMTGRLLHGPDRYSLYVQAMEEVPSYWFHFHLEEVESVVASEITLSS